MTTPVWDIRGNRGGTAKVTVAVTENDGSVADLTGFTGEIQARRFADDDDILLTGTVTVDTTTGLVQGVFDADDTAAADWNAAEYDMRISDGTEIEYVVRGTIRLRPSVTR